MFIDIPCFPLLLVQLHCFIKPVLLLLLLLLILSFSKVHLTKLEVVIQRLFEKRHDILLSYSYLLPDSVIFSKTVR